MWLVVPCWPHYFLGSNEKYEEIVHQQKTYQHVVENGEMKQYDSKKMRDFWNHMTKQYCEIVLSGEGSNTEKCPKLVQRGCGISDTCTAKQKCIANSKEDGKYVCEGKIYQDSIFENSNYNLKTKDWY